MKIKLYNPKFGILTIKNMNFIRHFKRLSLNHEQPS